MEKLMVLLTVIMLLALVIYLIAFVFQYFFGRKGSIWTKVDTVSSFTAIGIAIVTLIYWSFVMISGYFL